ncbi:hypothetical protein ACSCBZ_36300 [Streptomyces niveiscabiei]|uniref:hypothetical protein n=1 Tax=Streptomyces niveiscabiei TaxID=164115 RepID=UPI001F0A3F4E|nr:hypothetical protein [Streptomyces niveiscabiei]
MAAFGRHMHVELLEQQLCKRHPELADRVRLHDASNGRLLLVRMSGAQHVGLAQVRMGHSVVWAIMDPVLDNPPSVWPISTPDEVLVDALHAAATACLTGEPVASPWRWHESESSDMTELADLLDERKVRVLRVAVGNWYYPYGSPLAPRLGITSGDRGGSVLEAEVDGRFLRVSLKPTLGWTVDVHHPGWSKWGRIDVERLLRGRSSPAPGLPHGRVPVREIADLLSRGPQAWDVETSAWTWRRVDLSPGLLSDEPDWFADLAELWGTTGETSMPSPSGIAEAVFHQLKDCGFTDLRAGDIDTPIVSDTFHVVWHSSRKSLSRPEIERLSGQAAAAGEEIPKRLIVITSSGVTKPAGEFADQAKAFAFHLDRATGRLMGENSRARQALLPSSEQTFRELESW